MIVNFPVHGTFKIEVTATEIIIEDADGNVRVVTRTDVGTDIDNAET